MNIFLSCFILKFCIFKLKEYNLGIRLVSDNRNLKLCNSDEMKIYFYHMEKWFEMEDLGMLYGSTKMLDSCQFQFTALT